MSARRVLVLTGQHPEWKPDDEVVFLGPWCLKKPHEGIPDTLSPAAGFRMLPFHWDDRDKLRKDYDDLEGLHERLLTDLTASLNRFHKTGHSRRYWQILLDPWLMAYVGVMFDRWETVRLAMEGGEEWTVPARQTNRIPERRTFSFNDFTSKIMGDAGNERLFLDILRRNYRDQITFEQCRESDEPGATPPDADRKRLLSPKLALRKVAAIINPAIRFFTSGNRFLFQECLFDPLSLARVSLSLGQFPKLSHPELQFDDPAWQELPAKGEEVSRGIELDSEAETPFHRFLGSRIGEDLPTCVVEHFPGLKSRAVSLNLTPEVIVTGQSHWMNPLAKAWMADRVEHGARLAILEHGGSFPARKEFFNFEEEISDVKGTWFLPYHPRHAQVPPSKLVGHAGNRGGPAGRGRDEKLCLIVGGEYPKYVYRAIFYPMADQCLRSFSMVNRMISRLQPAPRAGTRIRPYHADVGWDTRTLYAGVHGENMIHSSGTLRQAFSAASLIVCTYPETTFSEAMVTGRPVILIYPPEINERHPVAFPLIEQMQNAKIIFYDPDEAADHINRIWDDPDRWWDREETAEARRQFATQAIRMNGNWLRDWKNFLLHVRGGTALTGSA